MTIEIIGEDPKAVKETTCRNCASRLRYTHADTYTEIVSDYTGDRDTYRRLMCPKCNEKITVPTY